MRLLNAIFFILGLSLFSKASPLISRSALVNVTFIKEKSQHTAQVSERVSHIHDYINDGLVYAGLATDISQVNISDTPGINAFYLIAFEVESHSPRCIPRKCTGELDWDLNSRGMSRMTVRDGHGIVIVEIGPGPKENDKLPSWVSRRVYFAGTVDKPEGVSKEPFSFDW
ncbi:hypothetical protein DFH05DRAFT_1491622 [Lentinula detonsa]|uniref:Uncharacterized protein n=1 Tax=Lentinula detonsa TaxID=2804962 RepID=A0A9W8P183_9AGAR|nr:hypothetical protein DFH05DRAFT_1491622 [Lentinula detonsa]KAJ3979729.1 hypothetical protein F5890DRAFT_1558400 [Lentinula detonsa]